MGQRPDLHAILEDLADRVYFQPPTNSLMVYPCIVYHRDSAKTATADNAPYRYTQRYQVTVIDASPDSDIPRQLAELPMCTYSRFFAADNLNHDVFNIYF
jgi:hypothetical protein